METDRNYFIVGIFVLATLAALAMFSLWLLGIRDQGRYTPYRIHFAESVNGLTVGSPVKFRGVPVGKVEDMAIDAADTRLIRVDISILKSTPVKTDTVAGLKLQGITGAVYVELSGSSPQAPELADHHHRGAIPEIPSKQSSLTALVDMLPDIFDKVSHIAKQVDAVLSDRNIAAFDDMMADWRNTSHDISGLFSHRNIDAFNEIVSDWRNASRDVSQLAHSLKQNPAQIINPSQVKGIPAP